MSSPREIVAMVFLIYEIYFGRAFDHHFLKVLTMEQIHYHSLGTTPVYKNVMERSKMQS